MKLFLVTPFLLSLLGLSYGNIFEKVFFDPEHPGKCVLDDTVLSPGEEKYLVGKCERFICKRSDGFGTVLSCDKQIFDAGCHLGGKVEPEAEFPYCCARHVICD